MTSILKIAFTRFQFLKLRRTQPAKPQTSWYSQHTGCRIQSATSKCLKTFRSRSPIAVKTTQCKKSSSQTNWEASPCPNAIKAPHEVVSRALLGPTRIPKAKAECSTRASWTLSSSKRSCYRIETTSTCRTCSHSVTKDSKSSRVWLATWRRARHPKIRVQGSSTFKPNIPQRCRLPSQSRRSTTRCRRPKIITMTVSIRDLMTASRLQL